MSTNAGFQLFPAPSTVVSPKRNGKGGTNPSRRPSTRRHAIQPQSPPQSAVERSQSPVSPMSSGSQDGSRQYDMSGRFSPPPSKEYRQERTQHPQQHHPQSIPIENPRSHTPTANRLGGPSNVYIPYSQRPQTPPLARINTSISPVSSPPRQTEVGAVTSPVSSPPRQTEVPAARSIFPTYNPDVRLEHQDYYPTVHIGDERVREIPRAVLSKRPYSPSTSEQDVPSLPSIRNQLQRNPSLAGTVRGGNQTQNQAPSRSGYANGNSNPSTTSSPPLRQGPTSFQRSGSHSPPVEQASSTEELKELWKVTNGWRVSPSEGRTFVLQMTSDPEEPVHTLSSSTDPFYTLRIEPTSTSAHLTMLRHDPSKASSTPSPTSKLITNLGLSSKPPPTPPKAFPTSSSTAPPSMKWSGILPIKKGKGEETIEVLTTTLEETHRRLPPNDGLVALLYPTAASTLVISHHLLHPSTPDTAIRQTAERECARLIWDADSAHYYLVHPCLSQPFIIRINKSPAWNRVEYVLEHPSLPNDLARMVRGVEMGWCVVDTGTAGGLDGVYIVDVAICALCVVAVTEEKLAASTNGMVGAIERFSGPPSPKFIFDDITTATPQKSPRFSLFNTTKSKEKKKQKKRNGRDSVGLQDFEVDLESQESLKVVKVREERVKGDKGPFVVRVVLFGVRCAVWIITGVFGCVLAVVIGVGGCLVKRVK